MMLPNQQPPIGLPAPGIPLPAEQVTTTAATSAGPNPPHVDYNHQPLLVSGLEHYVKPEEDERFHIS